MGIHLDDLEYPAGFNLDSIEGEKLPHFAQTLKTGAADRVKLGNHGVREHYRVVNG
jgi:hypothetical protein